MRVISAWLIVAKRDGLRPNTRNVRLAKIFHFNDDLEITRTSLSETKSISLIAPQDIGGLYLMRLTYKIRPIERPIPTEGEQDARRSGPRKHARRGVRAERYAPG